MWGGGAGGGGAEWVEVLGWFGCGVVSLSYDTPTLAPLENGAGAPGVLQTVGSSDL